MKDLISYIAQALVDHPEQVSVSEVEGNQTSVLELKVAKEDLGKVIGKQGRTARAMRTILSAASAKIKKRTVLEIVQKHAEGVTEQQLRQSNSRNGRYLAVTVTIEATSQLQLDNIYRALTDHDMVVMAL